MQDINDCRFPLESLNVREYLCPKCRLGALRFVNDIAEGGGPDQFIHRCTNCGTEECLDRIYPVVVVNAGFGVFEIPGMLLQDSEGFEEVPEEDSVNRSDIANRRPNMNDIRSVALDVLEAIDPFLSDKLNEAREDELLNEIEDVLECGLQPDDYPDSSYN